MNDIQVIERDGQRVLTTQQLAEEYGTESRRISDNFNANQSKYQNGVHYFKLEGDELREFKGSAISGFVGTRVNALYLWTERGALLHAKSLNTAKAWEVYGMLMETYFRAKEYALKPPSPAEALLQAVQLLAEQERKLNHQQEQITVINHRINNLDSIDTTGDRRHLLVKLGRRLAQDKGISHPAAWHLFDDAFNTAYRTNLTARRNNYAKRARIKDIGRPEYLEAVGQVEDGIRVMDKLLNGSGRCYGGGC